MDVGTEGVVALRALGDNYIWLQPRDGRAIVVDPGEASPVLEYAAGNNLSVGAILITHNHQDHVAGIDGIVAAHPGCEVIAPAGEGVAGATRTVADGEELDLGDDGKFMVHATPGHTAGHVAYVGRGLLLCGDALFSCGCGRLFAGTAADLARGMAVLRGLPDDLLVCCGHEYTLANIEFALAVEPDNDDLRAWQATAMGLVADNKPTLPVSLGQEKLTNPFLRADVAQVREAAARAHGVDALEGDEEVLGALRAWKDRF